MRTNHVRNPQGIWINSQVFREEALYFKANGYYNNDPVGSNDWFSYWKEQRKRCMEGYSVAGVKITGDHYFYLNFCPILKTEEKKASTASKKARDFPDFWDGDYEYFWIREIARKGITEPLLTFDENTLLLNKKPEIIKTKQINLYDSLKLESKIDHDCLGGGYNLIVGKSRRKGYSYKNASIGANNYFHNPDRITIYAAYEKRFLYPANTAIFTMGLNFINFINENTAWGMPSDVTNKVDHIKASYIEYKNGIKIERGYKSELMAISFKDNADALRGKDAYDVIIEESGAFGKPGLLKDCYRASEDCVKDGIVKTGLITLFGTSGDLAGGTADYAEMIQNPKRFDLLAFENIFEEKATNKIGFFHPVNWNLKGHYDAQGNSNKLEAKEAIQEERRIAILNGATSYDMNSKMQEKPLNVSEAFGTIGVNIFPVLELKRQKDLVIQQGLDKLKGQNVFLYRNPETNLVVAEPDIKNKLKRISNMTPNEGEDGCVVIWEYPLYNVPKGLYKIGYDPVRQDKGTSLCTYTVYKSNMKGSYNNDNIVAEFTGRRESNDENHKIGELLAEFYNTTIMYENEVPDVKVYFQRRRLLNMLALQPDKVISKSIKNSKTSRIYGCHMTVQLKNAGERYIKDWLEEIVDHDEDGNKVLRLNKIYSLRLLTELIEYNKAEQTKFDAISSLIMCLFQVQEEILGKEYEEKEVNSKANQLINLYKKRVSAQN